MLREKLCVCNYSDLPRLNTQHGFSIYKGILVLWDEDFAERVLGMLNKTPQNILNELLVIGEHKAGSNAQAAKRTARQA